MPTILMTGAAGLIGTMLRTRLAQPGRTLRLLDVAPMAAGPGEEAIQASVTDLEAMTAACQGVDAVVHLAVPGRRRPVVRGLPVGTAARIPGHLRGVGQQPGRLGLTERGARARVRAQGRRRGLRR